MFPDQETTAVDSKFNVANILSTMGSDELQTPTSYPMAGFLNMTSGTGTTPTLTPTTLANLEQTFIELQSVSGQGSSSAGCSSGAMDSYHPQSGFVPPVVDPSSREQSQDSFQSDSDDWEPAAKRSRVGGHPTTTSTSSSYDFDGSSPAGLVMSATSTAPRKYGRRSRHEKLPPEEERRRAVRRERNKVAAAKCRQRRVDHTNALVEETEQLEAEKTDLENEIQSLQQVRDQLEFLLKAHTPICKMDAQLGGFKIKTEPTDLSMSSSACSSYFPTTSSSASFSRPKTLALDKHKSGELPVMVSCAAPGIPLSTPSSGLFTYTSLDSLVDGSTGLTPLTSGPVSCGSQVHRSENDSGAPETVTSPTLISL